MTSTVSLFERSLAAFSAGQRRRTPSGELSSRTRRLLENREETTGDDGLIDPIKVYRLVEDGSIWWWPGVAEGTVREIAAWLATYKLELRVTPCAPKNFPLEEGQSGPHPDIGPDTIGVIYRLGDRLCLTDAQTDALDGCCYRLTLHEPDREQN